MGPKPATYANLEALPPNKLGEIIAGELYVSPWPTIPQVVASSRLGGTLVGQFDLGSRGPDGWSILGKPELHLGEDVLVPDLAGWRWERMPRFSETVGIPLAPDWLCEVLSPSTRTLDRSLKLGVYAREGVRHVWLVDPLERTLEVLRLEGTRYTLLGTHTGTARVHAEPFQALELALAILWGAR
jgi:Uma2 family endonuclease